MTSVPPTIAITQFSDVLKTQHQTITLKGTQYHRDLMSPTHRDLHQIYLGSGDIGSML